MYSLTRAVISVLLKDLKELSHVPLTFDPCRPAINILWQEKWGKPLLCIIILSMFMAADKSVKKTLTWQPHSTFVLFILFNLENRFEHSCDRWLGWTMHSCRRQASTQTLKKYVSMVGNSSFSPSFCCPAPSLSLESALRHMVKAYWNIWKKGGRVREREATVQKAQQRGQDVAPLFSGSPSFSFQHHSRTVLSPQAAWLK